MPFRFLVCCAQPVHCNMCKLFVLLHNPLLLVLVAQQATHVALDRCSLLACAPGLPTSSLDCLLTWALSPCLSVFPPLLPVSLPVPRTAWTWNDVHCVRWSSHPTTTRASSRSMWRATGKSAPCAASSSRWTASRRPLRTTCSLTSTATRLTSTRQTDVESQPIRSAYFLSPLKQITLHSFPHVMVWRSTL